MQIHARPVRPSRRCQVQRPVRQWGGPERTFLSGRAQGPLLTPPSPAPVVSHPDPTARNPTSAAARAVAPGIIAMDATLANVHPHPAPNSSPRGTGRVPMAASSARSGRAFERPPSIAARPQSPAAPESSPQIHPHRRPCLLRSRSAERRGVQRRKKNHPNRGKGEGVFGPMQG